MDGRNHLALQVRPQLVVTLRSLAMVPVSIMHSHVSAKHKQRASNADRRSNRLFEGRSCALLLGLSMGGSPANHSKSTAPGLGGSCLVLAVSVLVSGAGRDLEGGPGILPLGHDGQLSVR